MGQEEEKAGRLKSFAGYQVDTKVGFSSDSHVISFSEGLITLFKFRDYQAYLYQ